MVYQRQQCEGRRRPVCCGCKPLYARCFGSNFGVFYSASCMLYLLHARRWATSRCCFAHKSAPYISCTRRVDPMRTHAPSCKYGYAVPSILVVVAGSMACKWVVEMLGVVNAPAALTTLGGYSSTSTTLSGKLGASSHPPLFLPDFGEGGKVSLQPFSRSCLSPSFRFLFLQFGSGFSGLHLSSPGPTSEPKPSRSKTPPPGERPASTATP